MDLKTTLRNLVLLPKTGYEQKRDEFDYPEKVINFLNLIRDHYTKYHTTFALFFPSASNNALLADGGSIASLEKAVELFSANFPPPLNLFSLDAEIPTDVRSFLFLTTLGFTVSPQVMTSVNGKLFISDETNKLAIVNRVSAKGTTPYWFLDLNNSNVVSKDTVPSGSDVVAIINAVLDEAYAYYNASTIPTLIKNDIYNNGGYWVRQIADVLTYNRVSLADLDEMVSVLGSVFYNRPVLKCFVQKTGEIGKVVLSSKDNALLTSKVLINFNTIFGDWFSNLMVDTVDGPNSLEFVCDIDPSLTSISNMGTGYYCVMTDGKWDFIQHQVNYYLENNVLKTVDSNTGEHNSWDNYSHIAIRTNMTPMRFYVANTKKQTLFFRKDNGEVFNWGSSSGWINDLLLKVRTALKNTWLNVPVQPNPYVKVFTAGKVTLQYLQSIQVRDSILKSEYNKDLYLFPAFLITDSTLLTEDPYNPLNYRIDSVTIKKTLSQAISYIQNQLFAQDIATLNTMSARFDKSIFVNNEAKTRLDIEYQNMKNLDTQLQAKLLEAKNLFVTLDILKTKLSGQSDPVIAYREQIQAKLDADLASFTASEKLRIATAKAVTEQERLQAQLNAAQAANQAAIAEANMIKQQEIINAQATSNNALIAEQNAALLNQQASMSSTSQSVTSSEAHVNILLNELEPKKAIVIEAVPLTASEKKNIQTAPAIEVKKSKMLPIAAGLGVVAYFFMGKEQ